MTNATKRNVVKERPRRRRRGLRGQVTFFKIGSRHQQPLSIETHACSSSSPKSSTPVPEPLHGEVASWHCGVRQEIHTASDQNGENSRIFKSGAKDSKRCNDMYHCTVLPVNLTAETATNGNDTARTGAWDNLQRKLWEAASPLLPSLRESRR